MRLGVELLFELKRFPNERLLLLGCVAVVRVLLSRGMPNERVPFELGVETLRPVPFGCEPNVRLPLRNGLSFCAFLFKFPNERLPLLRLPPLALPKLRPPLLA